MLFCSGLNRPVLALSSNGKDTGFSSRQCRVRFPLELSAADHLNSLSNRSVRHVFCWRCLMVRPLPRTQIPAGPIPAASSPLFP